MLRSKVIKGASWLTVANILRQIFQIASLIIYAKFLTPDDFGLFAILMIFVALSSLFSNMGTGAAIIQYNNPTQELLSTTFFLNLSIGFMIFLLFYTFSNSLAVFFNNNKLEELFSIIGLNFVIQSFAIVQRALLEKELEFKELP